MQLNLELDVVQSLLELQASQLAAKDAELDALRARLVELEERCMQNEAKIAKWGVSEHEAVHHSPSQADEVEEQDLQVIEQPLQTALSPFGLASTSRTYQSAADSDGQQSDSDEEEPEVYDTSLSNHSSLLARLPPMSEIPSSLTPYKFPRKGWKGHLAPGRKLLVGSGSCLKMFKVNCPDLVWQIFADHGVFYRPMQRLEATGWKDISSELVTGPRFIDLLWEDKKKQSTYVGTFEKLPQVLLSPEEYSCLPSKDHLARITSTKSTEKTLPAAQARTMYRSGDLQIRKIDLRRIGFNHQLHDTMRNAAVKSRSTS